MKAQGYSPSTHTRASTANIVQLFAASGEEPCHAQSAPKQHQRRRFRHVLVRWAVAVRDPADANVVYTTPNSVMMTTIAARLTPEDIRNLASYLQGLR